MEPWRQRARVAANFWRFTVQPPEKGPARPGPVQIMSIPRSGHHWMIDSLLGYDPATRYCEFHSQGIAGCCGRQPCIGPVDVAKCHDYAGDARKSDRRKYVIQVRPSLPSIVSHFELRVLRLGLEDSPASWRRFATEGAVYRNRFARKWLDRLPARSMVLHYDDLLARPGEELARLLRFLHEREPDPARVAEIAAKASGGRDVRAFRHYEPGFFGWLTRKTRPADMRIERFRRF